MSKQDSTTNDTPKKASTYRRAQRFITGFTWSRTKISTLEKFWKKETNLVFGKRGNKEPKVLEVDNLLEAYDQENRPLEKLEKLVDAHIFLKDWSQEYDGFYPDAIEKLQEKVNESFTQEFDTVLSNIPKTKDYIVDKFDAVEVIAETFRQKIREIRNDNAKSDDQKLREESKEVFNFLTDLIKDNKVHMVSNSRDLAYMSLKMNAENPNLEIDETALNAKTIEFDKNNSRGFTDEKTGHVYMINENNAGLQHDLLHEAVHLLSAPNGKTILVDQKNSLNEGITEYFTKQYLKHLPIQDSEAYPLAEKLVKTIADEVGEDVIRSAYFNNEGIDVLKESIAIQRDVNVDSVGSLFNNLSQDEDSRITVFNNIKTVFGEDKAQEIIELSETEKTKMKTDKENAEKIGGNVFKAKNKELAQKRFDSVMLTDFSTVKLKKVKKEPKTEFSAKLKERTKSRSSSLGSQKLG